MHNVISIIFLFLVGGIFSQSIENVDFRSEGNTIVVTYDFFHPNQDSLVNIQIQFKNQLGTVIKPLSIEGDLKNVRPGQNKRIVWDVLADKVVLTGNYKAELFFNLIDNCELDGKIFSGNCIQYFGECKNDHLGSAISGFDLISHAVCQKEACTGCTDDLMVSKQAPNE